ncbi:MAG: NADH-quinone oxidoreductase subunit [Actinomycetota bacterium]|nr:NADH-quinone oxidoreductase subunit [Actinomycetota bacterium]
MIGHLLAQVAPSDLPPLVLPKVAYSAILPEIIVVVGALLVLAGSSLARRKGPAGIWALLTVLISMLAGASSYRLWTRITDHGPFHAVADAVVVDGFSIFIFFVILTAVILAALVADPYLRRENLDGPEFYVLMMLCASGGMLMAAANDLIVLFLGLEILSISLYVLAGFHSRRAESREAAMKYFVLGAFSSALFLYGVALVYGATGSTQLPEIAAFVANNVVVNNGVLLAGLVLLLVGLGFKVAAVPFHTWTPDVYQGAPSPVTGFMAAAAKAAGFAGLLRVFFSTFTLLRLDWQPLVWVLAVLTLVVGSVLALVQTDIKRMLAYSSISHAGYVLIGLQAGSSNGVAGSLFYLFTYTFMVLGSFAIITLIGRKGDGNHDLDAYRGLSTRRPALALAFTVFLLAQTGVPFTTGLWAKFYVISAAVEAHSYALALIAMLAAVVSAFFYLRVVVLMYTRDEGESDAQALPRIRVPVTVGAALVVTVGFTILVGILPSSLMTFARHATLFL